jgi:hypothetical protein
MQNDKLTGDGPNVRAVEPCGSATRTSGSEGHTGDRRCRRCGGAVQGRRRNGWCSDKCRLRDARELRGRKRRELLDVIAMAVEELRADLGCLNG